MGDLRTDLGEGVNLLHTMMQEQKQRKSAAIGHILGGIIFNGLGALGLWFTLRAYHVPQSYLLCCVMWLSAKMLLQEMKQHE